VNDLVAIFGSIRVEERRGYTSHLGGLDELENGLTLAVLRRVGMRISRCTYPKNPGVTFLEAD
jgi:hypothetical protein